jgi:hypothetical protein
MLTEIPTRVNRHQLSSTPASPPRLFTYATAVLSLLILMMAVAEATLWTHFLIDERNEYLSVPALIVIFIYGLHLHAKGQLAVSLPLFIPWLAYPVFTQADQIIDHMNIMQMRIVCHLILASIFATPIYVLVLAAQSLFSPVAGEPARRRAVPYVVPGLRLMAKGQNREGSAVLAMSLLLVGVWVAHQYLGTIMVLTSVGMGLAFLFYIDRSASPSEDSGSDRFRSLRHRLSLYFLIIGVLVSLGLYIGFKNRPGAYQGSPHYYHDPAQANVAYPLNQISLPPTTHNDPEPWVMQESRVILDGYGESLETLLNGYYLLDRNYNYAFHNALFIRHTPTVPGFRDVGLNDIDHARQIADFSNLRLRQLVPSMSSKSRLAAFLTEVKNYTAFNLRRANILREMSAQFERTESGLQHATHLYEGEAKVLGIWLTEIMRKHQSLLKDHSFAGCFDNFVRTAERIHAKYENRIVGF